MFLTVTRIILLYHTVEITFDRIESEAEDAAGIKHQTVHVSWTKIPTSFGRPLHIEKRDTTRYVGSRIYENGQLDRVLTPYGYIKDGVHHTFLHDYQGNVAAVVAGDSLVQRTSYYPYGLPHANAHGATANPYKYSGKEFDTFGGTDLYDFHARYHAPSTGRFMTVDQLCEEKPHLSGYTYCAGNPINLIDPTGMDEWEVDMKGKIDKVKETTEHDAFFIVDGDGNRMEGMSLSLDYGSVMSVSQQQTEISHTQYNKINVAGDENGTKVFEFLSKNTNVEWSNVQSGSTKEVAINSITTSHKETAEYGMDDVIRRFDGKVDVRNAIHSHPENTTQPSLYRDDKTGAYKGDIPASITYDRMTPNKTNFYIFLPATSTYIQYGPNSPTYSMDPFFELLIP